MPSGILNSDTVAAAGNYGQSLIMMLTSTPTAGETDRENVSAWIWTGATTGSWGMSSRVSAGATNWLTGAWTVQLLGNSDGTNASYFEMLVYIVKAA